MSKICKWCGGTVSNAFCVDFNADGRTFEICDTCVGKLTQAKNGKVTVDSIAGRWTDPDLKAFFRQKYEPNAPAPVATTTPQAQTTAPTPNTNNNTTDPSRITFASEAFIYQIAQDIRFLRNVVIASLIVAGVGFLISFIFVLAAL